MRKLDVLKLLGSVAMCELAGAIGSLFTSSNIEVWYAGLNKPAWTPPSWVFMPIWVSLYALMGISLFLVLNQKGVKSSQIFTFSVQLALNVAWSVVFFGLHSVVAGFVCILMLLVTITLTIMSFSFKSHLATYLLIPYLAWVIVATFLNYHILILN